MPDQPIPQRNASEIRSQMMRAGPGRPGKIEKARNPRRALGRLVAYLKPFALIMSLVFGFIFVSTVLALIGPYLMGQAIDKFIAVKKISGLATIALWMLVVYILGNLCNAASGWIMASVSQKALKGLRHDLFGHLQTLSIKFFDTNTAGELMSRLTNDIDAINQAVSQNVVSLVASVLSMAGILTAMFIMDVWLTLAALAVVPLMIWFTQFVARYTRKGFRELQKNLGEMTSVTEEAISGQRVIKAFRRNDSVIEAFHKSNQDVYNAAIYANTYALLLMPLSNQLGNLFVITIAGLGGYLALKGLVTIGTIAAFISYGRAFVNPLQQLANIYNAIQGALAGAERIFEVIDTKSEIDDAPDAATLDRFQGHVTFENVQFSYSPEKPIIKKLTLEANPGEIVALVGPTGAGKTTLVNLLTRFYEIDAGQICIDGKDIRQIKKDDLRHQLGLVLQDTFLFSASVMENIRYGRLEATDEEVIEAARMADADLFIQKLPQSYQTMLSERASNLSQGQRQMLSISRAILADPSILILDEATSSVDTRTEIRIQDALLRLMKGRTSFVIAHRLSTIQDANLLLVIKDGEIVEKGTHHQLLSQHGFYHHLYLSQFKGEQI
ncbi:MAG: ABC transporter ATP-binding protein [Anaerolineales bacterium]|jgi:ATP-binding cassette subfamily B protein